MKLSNNLRTALAFACAFMLMLRPVEARTKEGDKLLKAGQKAEEEKHFDAALNDFDKALATDP